jgi:hypothetical protein
MLTGGRPRARLDGPASHKSSRLPPLRLATKLSYKIIIYCGCLEIGSLHHSTVSVTRCTRSNSLQHMQQDVPSGALLTAAALMINANLLLFCLLLLVQLCLGTPESLATAVSSAKFRQHIELGIGRALLQASGALLDLKLGLLAGDAAERKRIAPHTARVLSRIARALLQQKSDCTPARHSARAAKSACAAAPATDAGKV